MTRALRLTRALIMMMAIQSGLGLLMPGEYLDPEWIRLGWKGNDWITLVIVLPLLLGAAMGATRGSPRSTVLWMGLVGYAVYNAAFYLFGAALNAFFPIYVVTFGLAVAALAACLAAVDPMRLQATLPRRAPRWFVGVTLVLLGGGLASVWLGFWAAYAFAGRATPIEPEAFKLVAALDLVMMVPALVGGGWMLGRTRPWGYPVAGIAAIAAGLYLTVLSVNSLVAVSHGLADFPGELPIWGALGGAAGASALVLLSGLSDEAPESGVY